MDPQAAGPFQRSGTLLVISFDVIPGPIETDPDMGRKEVKFAGHSEFPILLPKDFLVLSRGFYSFWLKFIN